MVESWNKHNILCSSVKNKIKLTNNDIGKPHWTKVSAEAETIERIILAQEPRKMKKGTTDHLGG